MNVKVTTLRRISQTVFLIFIIAAPLLSYKTSVHPPSRIGMMELEPPHIFPIAGDTWIMWIKGFLLIHPVAFIESIFSSKFLSAILFLGALVPFLITIIAGRVYCSFICPAGFILELKETVLKKIIQGRQLKASLIGDLRIAFFTAGAVIALIFSLPIISMIDPSHVLGREFIYAFTTGSATLGGIMVLTAVFSSDIIFGGRLWCSKLCPAGGGLKILGRKKIINIKLSVEKCTLCSKCNEACPYDLQPMDLALGKNFNYPECDNCGLCIDACDTGALSYTLENLP